MDTVEALPYGRPILVVEVVSSRPCFPGADSATDVATSPNDAAAVAANDAIDFATEGKVEAAPHHHHLDLRSAPPWARLFWASQTRRHSHRVVYAAQERVHLHEPSSLPASGLRSWRAIPASRPHPDRPVPPKQILSEMAIFRERYFAVVMSIAFVVLLEVD